MATLTISEPITLACSQCASGYYIQMDDDHGICPVCTHAVTPSRDVAPFMECDERMVWVDDVTLRGPRLLGYFVEEGGEED